MAAKPLPWNKIVLLLAIVLTLLIAGIVGFALNRSFNEGGVVATGAIRSTTPYLVSSSQWAAIVSEV